MSTDTTPASDNGELDKEAPAPAPQPDKKEPGAVPYSRFQEVNEQRKGLEATLNSLIDEMVPEDMRDLVPDLPPQQKVAWLKTAKERGIFAKPQDVPSSSPDAKRPGGKKQIDLSGLSAMQKMQHAFGQK
ncbi:hypothetical protein [Desulfovibrio sp. QI0442]